VLGLTISPAGYVAGTLGGILPAMDLVAPRRA
jgi:hypothetical protein